MRLFSGVQILVVFLAAALFAAQAVAADGEIDGIAGPDAAQIQKVISNQIDAFRADDGPRAYSFASPTIQEIFPNSDIFIDMVRRQYQPVYRPTSFAFAWLGRQGEEIVQIVELIGPDGLPYLARYTLQQQPDGSWRISGCSLLRRPAESA